MTLKIISALTILIISTFVFVNPSLAKEYRRQLTIDNTKNANDLADYQVSFLVNTKNLISLGRIRSDCTDIHIKDNDDKVEIKNLWIENCNNNATKIWVKVPKIPASTKKNIYMYYGTGVKTSDFSVEKTFIRTIPDLLVGFPFDEISGWPTDQSGNNIPVQWLLGTTITTGKFNNARQFVENNNYTWNELIYYNYSRPKNTFTMEAWVYPQKTIIIGGWTYGQSFVYWAGCSQCGGCGVPIIDAGFGLSVGTNGISAIVHSGCLFSPYVAYYGSLTGWNHIAVTVDEKIAKLYLNGVLVNSNLTPAYYDLIAPTYIGDPTSSTGPWSDYGPMTGIIDDAKIYNRALTPEEIRDEATNQAYATPNYPDKAIVRKFSSPDPTVSFTTLSLDIDIPDKNTDVKNNNKVTTNYKTATFTAKTIIAKRTPPSVFDNRVQIILDNNIVIPFKYDHEEGEQTVWQGTYKLPSGITNKTKPDGLTGSLETLEYGTTTANTPVTTTTHFQNLQPGFINSGYVVDFDIPSASVGAYTTDNSTSSAIIDYSPVNISSSNNDIIDDFISMFRALIQSILIRY